jgi:hypothetical protein
MVYAIIVLVLIGTVGIFTLELSSRTVKSVSDEHVKIQLRLYMKSAVEYALLWLGEDKSRSRPGDFGLPAYRDLNITYDTNYQIVMRAWETTIDVPESNGTVVLDVIGTFDATGAEPLIQTQRLLVKP